MKVRSDLGYIACIVAAYDGDSESFGIWLGLVNHSAQIVCPETLQVLGTNEANTWLFSRRSIIVLERFALQCIFETYESDIDLAGTC
jgi:hypothetical protein